MLIRTTNPRIPVYTTIPVLEVVAVDEAVEGAADERAVRDQCACAD
jgi:hypothetical protein